MFWTGEIVFPKKNCLIGYLILNGQPWNHILISKTKWTEKVMSM